MKHILFLHIRYPEFDRSSGDLRIMNMLRILTQKHKVALHVLHQPPGYLEAPANRSYAEELASLGVRTSSGGLTRHLRQERYDAVVIEYWYVARPVIWQVRALQPQTRILVDTEHVYFYSDQVREAAVGESALNSAARAIRKREELDTYYEADGIITTTEEDLNVVLDQGPPIPARTVPNIHESPGAPVGNAFGRRPNSIIFVGNFRSNEANADAMTWFCGEVFPLIRRLVPDATLRIVGNMPPLEVMALASAAVEITGYVPETAPYLDTSMVSVCPLRFGAGLKGKVGEAMMRGLPVVATSVGTQGMNVRLGEDIMIADCAELFAAAIVQLFCDTALWERMSHAGRDFVDRNFGFPAAEKRLEAVFGDLSWAPARFMPAAMRCALSLRIGILDLFNEHLAWRWNR